MKILAVLAAAGTGALAGWVCSLVPVWPIARVALATLAGIVVGGLSVAALVVAAMSRPGSGGIGAVSMGVSEVALQGGVVLLLGAPLGYVVLLRMGWSAAGLGAYGPVLAGAGGAVIIAAWLVRGMSAGVM